MEAVSYTKARNNLADLMEKVCSDHDPLIITRQKSSSVVVMSLEDYNAFLETSYLLQSPKSAERLHQAIEDFKDDKNFKKFEL